MSNVRGYTLIELLVVISIIAIMAVVGFVNFKNFSASKVTEKAVGQVQTLLRLAQSNASSGTVCGSVGGVTWSLILKADKKNIDLVCGALDAPQLQKTYTLENAEIDSIKCSTTAAAFNPPLTISYAHLSGKMAFSSTEGCVGSAADLIITLKNKINPSAAQKTLTISKGGAIDVR